MIYYFFSFIFGVTFSFLLSSIIKDVSIIKTHTADKKDYRALELRSNYSRKITVFAIVMKVLAMVVIFAVVIGLILVKNSEYDSIIF